MPSLYCRFFVQRSKVLVALVKLVLRLDAETPKILGVILKSLYKLEILLKFNLNSNKHLKCTL